MTYDPVNIPPLQAPPDFERALQELEHLVQRLEQGELSLEESLSEFERGLTLTRQCQHALATAEQKIRLLTEHGEIDFSSASNHLCGDKE